jgi:hypothetical protein
MCKIQRSALHYLKNYVIIYCLTEKNEESPENSDSFIVSNSEGVVFLAIVFIGIVCLAKYLRLC